MPRTVADQFVETLAAAGVKRIYGIVGDSLNGLSSIIRSALRFPSGGISPAVADGGFFVSLYLSNLLFVTTTLKTAARRLLERLWHL
jgi:hypothetical protein